MIGPCEHGNVRQVPYRVAKFLTDLAVTGTLLRD
jgi:hypothetical protein